MICDEDGNNVKIDVTYDIEENTITITPQSSYNLANQYYLFIGIGIESPNGKQLKEPIRMMFDVK